MGANGGGVGSKRSRKKEDRRNNMAELMSLSYIITQEMLFIS